MPKPLMTMSKAWEIIAMLILSYVLAANSSIIFLQIYLRALPPVYVISPQLLNLISLTLHHPYHQYEIDPVTKGAALLRIWASGPSTP